MNELLEGLKAVVQYRRKGGIVWITIAAYDSMTMAENYAKDCTGDGSRHWEYRAVEIPEATT